MQGPLTKLLGVSLAAQRRISVGTIAVLIVSLAAVGMVIYFAVGLPGQEREVIEEIIASREDAAPAVNVAEVVDAVSNRDAEAKQGYRYKVIIEDEATDGMAGIARIGGLVTFVDNVRVGEVVVVEVTRLKERVAEAVVVERLGWGEPPRPRRKPAEERREGPVVVGQTYHGVVEDVGAKGDGIVRVEGKVVFVPGVSAGDEITFIVTSDHNNFAVGRLAEGGETAAPPAAAPMRGADGADAVQAGEIYEVEIAEKDRKDPDRNGVARIAGLVVFVPDSQPGDRVRIRIKDRRPRFAFAEVIEPLGTAASAQDGPDPDQ